MREGRRRSRPIMHNRPMPAPAQPAAPGRQPNPSLRQIWSASPTLSVASLGLRLVRAFLPILMLYVGKLIIDEEVRLVGLGVQFDSLGDAWRSGLLDGLLWLLAFEFGLAIASDLIG